MKSLYWKIGISALAGNLMALWAADKLPLLRGGVRFEPAPSVSEHLASTRSVLQPRSAPNRFESVQSMRRTYNELLTWESRQQFIDDSVTNLLPGKWADALEILLAYSRAADLDEQLLAEIFRAGGPAAFHLAAKSGKVYPRKLGAALRESGLIQKSAIISAYLEESSGSRDDLTKFLVQAVGSEGDDIDTMPTLAGIFFERFGAKGLISLAERFTSEGNHLTDTISRGNVLDTLKHFATNTYVESVIDYEKRLAFQGEFDAASDNPELASVSEIRQHLIIETYGKLRAEGDEATLHWALTKVAPEFQKAVIDDVFYKASRNDGLRPILLALRVESAETNMDLVRHAAVMAQKAQRFSESLRTKQETFDKVSRLGKDRPEIAEALEMFRDHTR